MLQPLDKISEWGHAPSLGIFRSDLAAETCFQIVICVATWPRDSETSVRSQRQGVLQDDETPNPDQRRKESGVIVRSAEHMLVRMNAQYPGIMRNHRGLKISVSRNIGPECDKELEDELNTLWRDVSRLRAIVRAHGKLMECHPDTVHRGDLCLG